MESDRPADTPTMTTQNPTDTTDADAQSRTTTQSVHADEHPTGEDDPLAVHEMDMRDVMLPVGSNTDAVDLFELQGWVEVRIPEHVRELAREVLTRAEAEAHKTLRWYPDETPLYGHPEDYAAVRDLLADADGETVVLPAPALVTLCDADVRWRFDLGDSLPSTWEYVNATVQKAQHALLRHERGWL